MHNKDLCRDTSDECIFGFSYQESPDKFSHVGFACQSVEVNVNMHYINVFSICKFVRKI